MFSLNRILLITSVLLAPTFVVANDDVASALADIKKVMKARESRVNKAMWDVEKSQLNPDEFVLKKMPHEQMKFEGEPLKCRISHFSWTGKKDGYEYEDCTFLVNIKSDEDIRGMMVAIAKRTINGWEIDRNELTSQQNLRAEKIVNKEKYRFRRKID
ncbi:MAG: hypothetical protein ACJAS1_007443 [Oleiphilaceae bacterium]|jgi:hypothetical protein